jgi:hypothetical protein
VTLILSAFLRDAVVQVSDRRVVWPDGRVASEMDNKAVCVGCAEAHFAIAYTGLARIGDQPTDECLFEALSRLTVGKMTLEGVLAALCRHLDNKFRNLRGIRPDYRGLELCIAGYKGAKQLVGGISNRRDEKAQIVPVRDEFRYAFQTTTDVLQKDAHIFAGGNAAPLHRLIGRSPRRRLERRLFTADPEVAGHRLVAIIRAAASRSNGTNIGRDCMGSIVLPTGAFTSFYAPESGTPYEYLPLCVLASGAFIIEKFNGAFEEWQMEGGKGSKITSVLSRRRKTPP